MAPLVLSNYILTLEHLFRKSPHQGLPESKEIHVRFFEGVGVKSPRATRLIKSLDILFISDILANCRDWHDLYHFGAFKLCQFLR